jgi:hypothetical protein
MEKLTTGELSIERSPREAAQSIQLHWKGKCSAQPPGDVLSPFLNGVLLESAALKLPLELHFEAMDYISSATVAYLVQFLRKARDRGVPVVLVYDSTRRWQRLNFEALQVFQDENGMFRLRSL